MTTVPEAPLYLSRLLLNPRSRRVVSELANPYEMHRTLMRAFPPASDKTKSIAREEFGVLFRAEAGEHDRPVKVFVQSRVKPIWSALEVPDEYLCSYAGMPEYEIKDIMPACRSIENGQVCLFRLRANPVKRIFKVVNGAPDLKGKRVGLLKEYEQIDWLVKKGDGSKNTSSGGFEILSEEAEDRHGDLVRVQRLSVKLQGKQRGRKKENGRERKTTHLSVIFEGALRVTDADAFRETLVRGIGPAKAFGFGLLSVAPVCSMPGAGSP